jgi:hypothetical protein
MSITKNICVECGENKVVDSLFNHIINKGTAHCFLSEDEYIKDLCENGNNCKCCWCWRCESCVNRGLFLLETGCEDCGGDFRMLTRVTLIECIKCEDYFNRDYLEECRGGCWICLDVDKCKSILQKKEEEDRIVNLKPAKH